MNSIDKLRWQLHAFETMGYLEEEKPCFVAGSKMFDAILSENGAIVKHEDMSLEDYKYESVEEMFEGFDAIMFDVRFKEVKFLESDRIMPYKEYRKKVFSE